MVPCVMQRRKCETRGSELYCPPHPSLHCLAFHSFGSVDGFHQKRTALDLQKSQWGFSQEKAGKEGSRVGWGQLLSYGLDGHGGPSLWTTRSCGVSACRNSRVQPSNPPAPFPRRSQKWAPKEPKRKGSVL